MNEQKEIVVENENGISGVRDIAQRVMLAAGLSAFSTHCGESAAQHERLMLLANALLMEAVNRGFAHGVELRALLVSGLVSARTVDLLKEALDFVPEDEIAGVVMKTTQGGASTP